MTTVIVKNTGIQAKSFVEYARTLPFATVIEKNKKSFEEACAECNGVSVDVFIDELKASIKEYYKNA